MQSVQGAIQALAGAAPAAQQMAALRGPPLQSHLMLPRYCANFSLLHHNTASLSGSPLAEGTVDGRWPPYAA